MNYKTSYWNEIDKVKLPKVIDDEFVENMYKRKDTKDENTLLSIYGLCGKDLTDIDMTNLSKDSFLRLSFDSNTLFSKEQIEKFQPDKILKEREEYYESLNDLHEAGITGEGVDIVLIDDPFNHLLEEFKDVDYHDESLDEKDVSCIHGTAVTSILKNIAPNANIHFYAFKYDGNNRQKFDEERIKVISDIEKGKIKADILSLSSVIKENGKEECQKYINGLQKQGCEFIDSNRFSRNFTHGNIYNNEIYSKNLQYDVTDEEYESFVKEANISIKNLEVMASQADKEKRKEYFENISVYKRSLVSKESYEKEVLKMKNQGEENKTLVLSGGITYTQNDGNAGKMYCGNSSLSWSVPQVSAMYSLAKQLDKNISYDEFCSICSVEQNGKKVINPEKIVRSINDINKEKAKTDKNYIEIYEKSSSFIDKLDKIKENKEKIK